jgi:hypothetical protein
MGMRLGTGTCRHGVALMKRVCDRVTSRKESLVGNTLVPVWGARLGEGL